MTGKITDWLFLLSKEGQLLPTGLYKEPGKGIFYFIIDLSGYSKILGCESEFYSILRILHSCNFAHKKQNDRYIVF